MYQVQLTVITAESCHSQLNGDSVENIEQHEVCAEAYGKNTCQGDSGGPIVDTVTGRQVATVSYGVSDCTRREPSVFTSVKDNLSFIKQVMKQTRPQRRPGQG